jgi:hypothetical protein
LVASKSSTSGIDKTCGKISNKTIGGCPIEGYTSETTTPTSLGGGSSGIGGLRNSFLATNETVALPQRSGTSNGNLKSSGSSAWLENGPMNKKGRKVIESKGNELTDISSSINAAYTTGTTQLSTFHNMDHEI